MIYRVEFVHKIRPSTQDAPTAQIPDNAFSNKNTLAKSLRAVGVLCKGQSIREMRVEGEKVIVFPSRGIWHSITLTLENV